MADNNNEELLAVLKSMIDKAEQDLTAMIGAKLYEQEEGFTQSQLYTMGGRKDCVFTLTLRSGSESIQKYGDLLSVCFVYTRDERKALEEDVTALDNEPFIRAKLLVPGEGQCQNAAEILLKEGLNTKDIVELIVSAPAEENNTFPSKEKRTPKVMEIPFEPYGKGKDIGWEYGLLKRQKKKGVGLMPNEEAEYLAYKIILEPKELTEEERSLVFNSEGKIGNNTVAYYYLMWKNEAGCIKDEEMGMLNRLKLNQFCQRVALVDETLKGIGLTMERFTQDYPKAAGLLVDKMLKFNDRSFNTTGKFPLYMNFESLLHIYFRHTEEMNVSSQFAERDKFQLEEKDILTVIDVVMRGLNDEYQAYKETHPNGSFYRAGKMAYYYNGDYYHVDVNPDGSISTFYKGSGKKQ